MRSVGQVPNGAIVERAVPATVVDGDRLTLILHEPDFTTAARVAEAINEMFTPDTARALDRSAIELRVPSIFMNQPVEFMAIVEELTVTPDVAARVVINERTGTIVMGHRARIATVAVAHGGLTVRVEAEPQFGFLPPVGDDGQLTPVVVETTRVDVQEECGRRGLDRRRRQRRGRGAGAERHRCHAPGHHRHPAGDQSGRSALRRAGNSVGNRR